MRAQIDFTEEIIVDLFAGGGGASTGIEMATGRAVDIAINHDPAAILMHRTNHPWTEHIQTDIWDVDPVSVCRGRPVGLLWMSPDCKHFSKAKGGKPRDKTIRGLAWVGLRWAGTVKPRVIVLENVEEFTTWGPVRKGRPVKRLSGITFQKFVSQLRGLGYAVDYRELVAADYEAPTIRKRFYLVARRDGKPITWPEPTHNKDGTAGKQKWRSAAEIIDWTLPCPSIFESKAEIKERYGLDAVRPLADKTMRRIIKGVDQYTIKSGKPFIVQDMYNNAPQSIEKPLSTITAVGTHELISPLLTQYHDSPEFRGQSVETPIMTMDAANRYGLAAAHLTEYYGNAQDGLSLAEPLHTATAKDREGLTIAHITKYYGGIVGASADEPLPTITTQDHNALTSAFISKFYGMSTGQGADEPLHTVTQSAGHFGLVTTTVERYIGNLKHWTRIRALLNEHCGYTLADDEVILLWIEETPYFISDIGLRMLVPREQYSAQGFPDDYIIDQDYTGKPYPKTQQTARCGNSVCPPVARAIVAANYAKRKSNIRTMADLEREVAI